MVSKYDTELLNRIHSPGSGKPPPLYPKPNFKVEDYPPLISPVKAEKPQEDPVDIWNYVSVYNYKEEKQYALDVNTVTGVAASLQYDDCMYINCGVSSPGIVISKVAYYAYVAPLLDRLCKKVDKVTGKVLHIDD